MPTRTGKTMRTNLHEFHSWLKITVQTQHQNSQKTPQTGFSNPYMLDI
jgi:hypothetical protein